MPVLSASETYFSTYTLACALIVHKFVIYVYVFCVATLNCTSLGLCSIACVNGITASQWKWLREKYCTYFRWKSGNLLKIRCETHGYYKIFHLFLVKVVMISMCTPRTQMEEGNVAVLIWKRGISFMLRLLCPRGKNPRYPLGGTQSHS